MEPNGNITLFLILIFVAVLLFGYVMLLQVTKREKRIFKQGMDAMNQEFVNQGPKKLIETAHKEELEKAKKEGFALAVQALIDINNEFQADNKK